VSPYLSSGGTYAAQQHFPQDVQTQLDDLINKAVASTDQAQRTQMYSQLQNLAYQNALDLFGVQPLTRDYTQEWVHGWYYNPIVPTMANIGINLYDMSKSQ